MYQFLCICVCLSQFSHCHQMSVPGNTGKQWSLRAKSQLPWGGATGLCLFFRIFVGGVRSQNRTQEWSDLKNGENMLWGGCWDRKWELRRSVTVVAASALLIWENRVGCGCIMCCFDTVSQGKAAEYPGMEIKPREHFPQAAVQFVPNKRKARLQSWWKTD